MTTPTPQQYLEEILRRVARVEAMGNPRDVENQMRALAAQSSAAYALQHMVKARPIRATKYRMLGTFELIEHAVGLMNVPGFVAEFGVFEGKTLRLLADNVSQTVFGLDSFEGLPEDWSLEYGKGAFDLGGNPPDLGGRRNVRLVKGWFEDTVPQLLELTGEPAALLHIDCDLYSSTRSVLFGLKDRIVPGTVIIFDEYFNYPGWEEGEFKAFREFCEAFGATYRYEAFAPAAQSVVVTIERVASR